MSSAPDEGRLKRHTDLSLFAGGPLFQLWRRTHLAGDELEWTRRRMIVMTLITWLPLLLLSIVEGRAWGSSVELAFLEDVETHAKLLVALPLLILAELTVHRRLSRIIELFHERGLVPEASRLRFEAAIASAMRLRNSVAVELVLIAFVYLAGVSLIWRTQVTLFITSWYAVPGEDGLKLTSAGWWLAAVSLPFFQFILLRWFFRLFIWARFLWQVARIPLSLPLTHPDRAAGLHFLSTVSHGYVPVLLAQGAVLSGFMANRIFYTGAKLLSFKVEIIGTVALLVFVILGPLLVFAPKIRATRRRALEELGTLGQSYAGEFEHRWLRPGARPGDPLLGTADLQSLADLHNSFHSLSDIQLAPFSYREVLTLVIITLLPVAPLLLTTFSLEQLLESVVKALF